MRSLRLALCILFFGALLPFATMAETFYSQAQLLHQLDELEDDYYIEMDDKISTASQWYQHAARRQWVKAEVKAASFIAYTYALKEDFDQAEHWIATYRNYEHAAQDRLSRKNVVNAQMYIAALRGDIAQFTQLKLELVELIAQFVASGNEQIVAETLYELGSNLVSIRRPTEALEPLKQAIRMFQQQGRYYYLNNANNSLANVYRQLGDHQREQELFFAVLNDKQITMTELDRSITLYNIGLSYVDLGQEEQAAKYFLEARGVSEKIADEVGIAYADIMLSEQYLSLGQYRQALVQLNNASEIFTETQNITQYIILTNYKARALTGLKQFAQAKALLAQLQPLVEAQREGVASLHLANYEWELAQGHYQQAILAYQRYADLKVEEADTTRQSSMVGLLAQFRVEQANAEKRLLEHANSLKQIQLDRVNNKGTMLYAFAAGAALLCSVIVSLWRRERDSRLKLQQLASQDFLTGAPNRRAVMRYANKLLSRSERDGSPLSIAIIDLDHFKQLNDQYGHSVGDKVLQAFADICCAELRNQDQFGRFGGEEWLLVLPDTRIDALPALFARLQQRYAALSFDELEQQQTLTFSMGAAQWRSEFADLEGFIKVADNNVYHAKRAGRDRLMLVAA